VSYGELSVPHDNLKPDINRSVLPVMAYQFMSLPFWSQSNVLKVLDMSKYFFTIFQGT